MRHAKYVLATVVLALTTTCFTGHARDRSFTSVLHGLQDEYQFKQRRVPGLWLAKCAVKVAHRRGVSKLDFAFFENDCFGRAAVPEFEERVHSMLGTGWRPFVQVNAPRRHERTLLFARPNGRHMDIFVLSLETDEAVALFARIHPKSMKSLIDNPRTIGPDHEIGT